MPRIHIAGEVGCPFRTDLSPSFTAVGGSARIGIGGYEQYRHGGTHLPYADANVGRLCEWPSLRSQLHSALAVCPWELSGLEQVRRRADIRPVTAVSTSLPLAVTHVD